RVHDSASWEQHKQEANRYRGLPWSDYRYYEPILTPSVRDALAQDEGPLISVLVPVYNTDPAWLQAAIDSVRAQWYPHWELCLVDDCSDRADTCALLEALDDSRIRMQRLETNQHISGASNAALAMARGDYVALLDHDDELTPDALYRCWQVIRDEGAEFVYSDEDKCNEAGVYCEPHFKADFSPELFHSQNYLCHLAVLKRSLVDSVGGFTLGMEGAQDYDLFLKVAEQTERIIHIPRVLYHWRKVPGSTAMEMGEKSYAQDAGRKALAAAIQRRGLAATAQSGAWPGTYRVRYAIKGEPLVSIIVPFRDKPELLDQCLVSILERSTWKNFEIIGVNNGSEQPETRTAMTNWATRDDRIRFVDFDAPFNYAAINNFAVTEHARGEHVLLLNNDIEVITPDWIEALLEFSQQPGVGAVGGLLLFPDETIQHAGVIIGLGGIAGHSHKNMPRDRAGYKARPHLIQNLCAVTGACLMVKRSLYEAVGGLDAEAFAVTFNDVDFGVRLMNHGLRNVYTPFCVAWHHESQSRGYEDTPAKRQRFGSEIQQFRARHGALLERGDPYYSPNLTLAGENFRLSKCALAARARESDLESDTCG
ncbi:MAG: glycosyltransferase, partial [Pseudomonadota bacterium]